LLPAAARTVSAGLVPADPDAILAVPDLVPSVSDLARPA